jgi:hypothetical protein
LIELPLKKYQPVISKAMERVAQPVPVRFCVIPPISFDTCWARSLIESANEFIISPFQSGIHLKANAAFNSNLGFQTVLCVDQRDQQRIFWADTRFQTDCSDISGGKSSFGGGVGGKSTMAFLPLATNAMFLNSIDAVSKLEKVKD